MGNIGTEQTEYEFEPLTTGEPVHEEVPTQVPQRETVPV